MFLVRFAPLKKPMTLDPLGHLVHSVPSEQYAVFGSVEDAEQAIRLGMSDTYQTFYEIVPCETHESEILAATRKSKKVARAKAKELRAMAADGKEIL